MASTNREHLAASRRFFPVRLSEKIGRIYRSTGLTQIDAVLDLTEWLFIRLNNLITRRTWPQPKRSRALMGFCEA